MSRIDEIHKERKGIRIWTVGSDDFFIHEEDFKLLKKALREFKKKRKWRQNEKHN